MSTLSSHWRPLVVSFVSTLLIVVSLTYLAPAQALESRTLTLSASRSTAPVSGKVTFSGKVSKTPRGTNVKIQRKIGKKWVSVVTTRTTSAGAYAVKVRLPAKAKRYLYRAYAPGFEGLKPATSAVVTVKARS